MSKQGAVLDREVWPMTNGITDFHVESWNAVLFTGLCLSIQRNHFTCGQYPMEIEELLLIGFRLFFVTALKRYV